MRQVKFSETFRLCVLKSRLLVIGMGWHFQEYLLERIRSFCLQLTICLMSPISILWRCLTSTCQPRYSFPQGRSPRVFPHPEGDAMPFPTPLRLYFAILTQPASWKPGLSLQEFPLSSLAGRRGDLLTQLSYLFILLISQAYVRTRR